MPRHRLTAMPWWGYALCSVQEFTCASDALSSSWGTEIITSVGISGWYTNRTGFFLYLSVLTSTLSWDGWDQLQGINLHAVSKHWERQWWRSVSEYLYALPASSVAKFALFLIFFLTKINSIFITYLSSSPAPFSYILISFTLIADIQTTFVQMYL